MSTLAGENIRKNGGRGYLLALILMVVASGLILGIYLGYQSYWRQTPRYALWQMVRAMQANDTQTLWQYIDLPAVVDSLVDQSSGEVEAWLPKDPNEPDDQVTRLGRQFIKKFAKFLAPKLVLALEPQIKTAVANYLAALNTAEKAALAAIPAQAQIRREDGSAWVTLSEPKGGQKLRFRLAKPEGAEQWRLVEVNYQDLRALLDRQVRQ